MPESVVVLNILMAGSMASLTAVEQALLDRGLRVVIHRVDSMQTLRSAVEIPGWHVAISDLELTDFTVFDLVTLLTETGTDIPVILIEGTGDEDIVLRCLATGMCRSIHCTPDYLRTLPNLMGDLLRRSEREHARGQIEKNLLESEERFLDVLDHTSDLIQCVAPDGSFVYTNRAWREAMGYSENEVRALKLADVLHPDSQMCCQDRFSRLLAGETLECIDFKFVTKSGEPIYLAGDCGSIIKDSGVISTRGIFKNITDTIRAQEALKITEARYQALYDNAPDIYMTLGRDGNILSINQNGARMLGYAVAELIGESVSKLVHPEDQRVVFECIEALIGDMDACSDIDYRKVRKDGSIFWVHQRASLQAGADVQTLLVVCRDITEKRGLEDQLVYQASHDGLTGLVNRREFEHRFMQVLERSADLADQHALCFLDLDQFKTINDNCGHMAGDELLRQVATLLGGLIRSRDTLARIGGDEFALLMEHASLDQALQLAEKIRAGVGSFEFRWREEIFSIGVSIGVVPIRPGCTMGDILNQADLACYAAKKAGRNRVHAVPADAGASNPPGAA